VTVSDQVPHLPAPGEPGLTETLADDRVLAPARWVAALIVPVLTAAFVILYLFPGRTRQLWAWTIMPSMSALVMGAGYGAGAHLFLRAATAREWHRVSVGFLGAWLFASLLGVTTILHWDRFNHDHVSFWGWLALYVITPVLLPWLGAVNRRTDPRVAAPGEVVVPRRLRLAVGTVGVVWLAFALAMFVNPDPFLEWWPWTLTTLTARSLSAFLAFPALMLVWFLFDERWSSFEIALETAAIGMALVGFGVLRATDDFGGDGRLPRLPYAAALVATLAALVTLRVTFGARARSRPAAG
jgi:hypothetical protein